MCILIHFANEHSICSVQGLSLFFCCLYNCKNTELSDSDHHIVAWEEMFKHVVNCANLMSVSLCRHLVQPLFGAIVLLLFIACTAAEERTGCTRVCAHTNTHMHISVSKRASAFTLLSNCLAPHTPAKIP